MNRHLHFLFWAIFQQFPKSIDIFSRYQITAFGIFYIFFFQSLSHLFVYLFYKCDAISQRNGYEMKIEIKIVYTFFDTFCGGIIVVRSIFFLGLSDWSGFDSGGQLFVACGTTIQNLFFWNILRKFYFLKKAFLWLLINFLGMPKLCQSSKCPRRCIEQIS